MSKIVDALINMLLCVLAAIFAMAALPLGMGAAALLMLGGITSSLTSKANENA